jgi:hypothetical protein
MSLTSICLAQEFGTKPAMSHEAEVVRTAYSKLSYATQVGMIWHAIAQHDRRLEAETALGPAMNEQLQFQLVDFKIGKISDVGKAPWTSLVDAPVGILRVQYQDLPVAFANGTSQASFNIVYADVEWKTPPDSHIVSNAGPATHVKASKTPTVKQVLRALRQPNNGGEWTRYASYSVVAKLHERSISYRATFLFSGKDATEEILPLDYATAMKISSFVKTPMYPAALVNTSFREIPFVQAWIESNALTGCKTFHEPEVCCDPKAGRCGVASEDLQRSLSGPIGPDMKWIVVDRSVTPERTEEKR